MKKVHSVTLNIDKCKGCTSCLKNCPTQAIRIRNGKARIINEKCIDCGECVLVCPNHAKSAITDSMEDIRSSEYACKAALVSPSTVAQFDSKYSYAQTLAAIKNTGFDYVFEVAYGAEIIGRAIKYEMVKKPRELYISSACSAAVKLILTKFPSLAENIIDLKSPMTVTAELAAEAINKETGLEYKDIGIYFVTPCAAKATEIYNELSNGGIIKGAVSIRDLYREIRKNKIPSQEEALTAQAASSGLDWAVSGGESAFLDKKDVLHVSGVRNILKCLEDVDMGKLKSVKFLELLACTEGCVGGCLTVESPFVAKKQLQIKSAELRNKNGSEVQSEEYLSSLYESGKLTRENGFKIKPEVPLGADRIRAIELMNATNEVLEVLPGFDCGSCGAPSCFAMAEDVALGEAVRLDCIFLLKDTLANFSRELLEMTQKVVPLMNNENADIKQEEDKK